MNRKNFRTSKSPSAGRWMWAAVFFAVIVSGCATTRPSNFYTLQPIRNPADAGAQNQRQGLLRIVVGPIRFPDYLDRPQIVTRMGPNELKIDEFNRWAGDLRENFTRVLAENLSMLLGSDRVSAYPWQGSEKIDYQVTANVLQFDGKMGADAVLKVQWTIYGKDDRKILISRSASLRSKAEGAGYSAVVVAENQLLTDLSREIASTFRTLAKADRPD